MEARRTDELRFLNRIALQYLYTPGVAGQRFFEVLKEKGKLLAARCGKCGERWMPARLFCPACFVGIDSYEEVPPKGRLKAYAWRRRGEELIAYGLIEFEGYRGGLVQRLLVKSPEELKPGIPVAARLAERREGSWNDILGFEPLPEERGARGKRG
jgi:uncharacterized OB-fold protein